MGAEPLNVWDVCTVGLEATTGTQALVPVKGQFELDLLPNSGLRGNQAVRRAEIANRGRGITKGALGPYTAGGDLNFLVTPDKVTRLNYGVLTALTASALTTGAIPHVFKPENAAANPTLRPFTIQHRRADSWIIFPNQYISRLTFRAPLDGPLSATASMVGAGPNMLERLYSSEQSDAGIVASTADAFEFFECAVQLAAGDKTSDAGNFEITFDTGLATRNAYGQRGPRRAGAGKASCTGSFDLYFSSEAEYKRWMANTVTVAPFTVGNTLQTLALQLKFTSGANIWQFDAAKAYYEGQGGPTVDDPTKDFIIQKMVFQTLWDASSVADGYLSITNSELDTAITTAGTPIA